MAVTTQATALAQLWRAKQLEYSFLRTAIDRYADFGQITSDALDYASTALRVALASEQRRQLLTLLSRFDLSPKQATRWFDEGERSRATALSVRDAEIQANPYRIIELDLGDRRD